MPDNETQSTDSDTPQDYDSLLAQARAGLKGATPPGTPPPTPTPHPVQTFWDKLLHGVDGKSRIKEVGRSVARGVTNAVTETGDTIAEGAAFADRKTGLGEALTPGFNAAYDEKGGGAKGLGKGTFTTNADGENVSDHYMGKRSDDPLASFTESATQFTAGFAASGELKLAQAGIKLGALKGAAHVIGGLARGAAVDGSMFDPYEAQLAELAASSPVPILKQVGQLLSVKDDDGALVARIKRAAAGLVPAATIEGLIAGTRALRSAKIVASSTATEAEKTAAHETLASSSETLQAVADGTHVPEGAHVTVKPTEDGQFTIEKVGEDTTPLASAGTDAASPIEGVQGTDHPVFPDQAEALQQAESINMGLDARENVGRLDEPTVTALTDAVKTPDALKALASDPTQLDGLAGSYHNSADDDAKLVSDIAQRIHDALPGIRQGDNTLADADVKDLAKNLLGYVPEDRALDVVGALHGSDGHIQSVTKAMAEMVAGAKGRQLAKLSDLIDARPHDPVLMGEAVQGVQNYFNFIHKFGMVESDAARMLRLAQQRAEIRATDVKFATPAVATEHVAAAESASTAIKDVSETVKKLGTNLTDTNAVSAADFSLARARSKVEAALKKIQDGDKTFETDAEGAVNRANDIRSQADKQRAGAIALTPEQEAAAKAVKTNTVNPIEQLSHLLDSAENQLDAAIEKAGLPKRVAPKAETTPLQDLLRKNQEEQAAAQGFKNRTIKDAPQGIDGLEQSAPAAGGTATPLEGLQSTFEDLQGKADAVVEQLKTMKPTEQGTPAVAGMASRDASPRAVDAQNVAATLRMIKMAGGDPRNASAVVRASAVQWNKGIGARVYEYFANSLLSGVKTLETISGSGMAMSFSEPAYRVAAGIATGNRALYREGVDMLYGNMAYLSDNVRSAAAAFREGRSIIDPIPPRYATGGVTGTIIRTPGRAVGMIDEFLTATNYRSYVRAKSLRLGREQGLEGAALDARVAQDLRASFDPQTGIATIPEALKYAEVPSFKQPLGDGFGKGWQDMAQDNLAVRFITPFVKAPVNIFRYVLDATPGLNLVAQRNRDIIRQGGEAAAILHTRSAIATSMYGFGLYQASQGNLTGRGPSDPELKKLWLDDHQPYSLKVGGQWVSYRRMDPFGMPLGLIADTHTFLSEMGDKDVDAEHYAAAVVSSISQNMISRSYMSGLSEFMGAFAEGDANKVVRYAGGFLGNAVPQGAASLNPDPYYREVRSVMDGVVNRIPGYSESLPSRHNAFGEKTLKADGVLNRGANMFQVSDAKPTVADQLVDLKRALPAFPQKLDQHIDLSDKGQYATGKQDSPYERIMQLVRSPEDGRPPLRSAMESLVQSPKWQEGTNGAQGFFGGDRYIYAKTLKESYEQRALKQVMEEYPKLKTQYEAELRMRGAAITSGESGVKQIESMMGVKR